MSAPSGGNRQLSLDSCQNCERYVYFDTSQKQQTVHDVYPPVEDTIDERLPENVQVALRESYSSSDSENWNACVTMCRRGLQEAVDDLGATGANLRDQIDDLDKARKITPDLKAWAHETRLGGNLGAHGSTAKKWADKEDAEEILEFAKWFMQYTYVLPAQLAERRARVSGTP